MKFGEHLIANRSISLENLEEAVETQRYRKLRLGRLLRDLGHLTQNELNKNRNCSVEKDAPFGRDI